MTRFLPFGSRSKTIQVNTLGGSSGGGIPRDGLVAEYLLATNSLDTSGNGYDGTDTDMSYSAGSAVFNGSTSFINITSDVGINGGICTISCWIKANNFDPNGGIFQTMNSATSVAYVFRNHPFGTGGIWASRIRRGIVEDKTESSLSLNTWHNLIMTYNLSNLDLYINGVNVGNIPSSGNGSASVPTGTHIGKTMESDFYFSGNIKKARIYNRVLNAGEIAALYAEG